MPNLWKGETDAQITAALMKGYPTLRLVVDGRRVIEGAFNLSYKGQFLGGFQVQVLLHKPDVLGLPTVREVAGRIPRVPDRHINPGDGSACLYLPEDLVVRRKEPFGIVAFLEGPVRSFFLGQLAVESGAAFPLGEWAHGAEGVKQMLGGLLGFADVDMSIAFLELLSKKVIKGHWRCPCGSRRALRECHQALVRRLRRQFLLTTRRFLLGRTRLHFQRKAVEKRRWRSLC